MFGGYGLAPISVIDYELKTPYRDGTTHVIFEPPDFIAKLAALVPPPRANLTRFHGVRTKHSVSCPDRFGSKGHSGIETNERQLRLGSSHQ
jgi:hypothetical protein